MESDGPGEAVEGVEAVEGLLTGALLHALDALEAPAPHLDVEVDEGDEQEATDGIHGLVARESLADHQQGIVGAVHQHRVEQGMDEMLVAVRDVELGQREVIAHDDGKEEMCRDGQYAAHQGGAEGVVATAEDIHDVLDAGEAQRQIGGIDDAVEILVEITAFPDDEHQEDELPELLAEACHHEAVEEARGDGVPDVVDEGDGALLYGGGYDAETTREEGYQQLAQRLGAALVFAVDEDEQQDYRQHGRDKYYIHDTCYVLIRLALRAEILWIL